jgi:hypothetical protein
MLAPASAVVWGMTRPTALIARGRMPVRLPFEYCVAELEKRLTAGLVLPAEATPTEHLRLPERIERMLSVCRPC